MNESLSLLLRIQVLESCCFETNLGWDFNYGLAAKLHYLLSFKRRTCGCFYSRLQRVILILEGLQAESHDDKMVQFAAFIGNALAGDDSGDNPESPKEALQKSLSQGSLPVSNSPRQTESPESPSSSAVEGGSPRLGTNGEGGPQKAQGDAGAEIPTAASKQQAQPYRAHIPGRVIYIYRCPRPDPTRDHLIGQPPSNLHAI